MQVQLKRAGEDREKENKELTGQVPKGHDRFYIGIVVESPENGMLRFLACLV